MRPLISILTVCFALISYAQIPDYFEESQTWNMSYATSNGQNQLICSEYSVYVDSDTIIGSQPYKIIKTRFIDFINPGGPTPCAGAVGFAGIPISTSYLRQSSDSIFQYDLQMGSEQLLITYNLQIGDTLSFYGYSFPAIVDSIDTYQLNGNTHRRFFLNGGYITLIEGFLFEGGSFTLPLSSNFHGFGIAGVDVICFEENFASVWQNPSLGMQNCNYISLGVQEDSEPSQLSVYPNPASDLLILDFPQHESNSELFVYALHGGLVQRTTSTRQIDVSHLPAGVYMIALRGKSTYKTRVVIDK